MSGVSVPVEPGFIATEVAEVEKLPAETIIRSIPTGWFAVVNRYDDDTVLLQRDDGTSLMPSVFPGPVEVLKWGAEPDAPDAGPHVLQHILDSIKKENLKARPEVGRVGCLMYWAELTVRCEVDADESYLSQALAGLASVALAWAAMEGIKDTKVAVCAEYDRAKVKHAGMTLDEGAVGSLHRIAAVVEEVGEVARCLSYDGPRANLGVELIQVAHLACAWMKYLQEEATGGGRGYGA